MPANGQWSIRRGPRAEQIPRRYLQQDRRHTKGSGDTGKDGSVRASEEDAYRRAGRIRQDGLDRTECFDREDHGTEDQVCGEEGIDGDRDGIGELLCLWSVSEGEDDLEGQEHEVCKKTTPQSVLIEQR